MTTPGYVQVPADSSGKKVDTSELIRGSDSATVERQNVVITDASDELGRARVTGEDGRGALSAGGDVVTLLIKQNGMLEEIRDLLTLVLKS
jgi:hypothetical protein